MDCPEELKFYRFGSNQAEKLPLAGFPQLNTADSFKQARWGTATFAWKLVAKRL